ncbi:MAG: endolytic transglycosylase MltG [Propionibacteriales bacterium]|nr:endolytic transglycosylase MltG [Propionibacteriales bacterium]
MSNLGLGFDGADDADDAGRPDDQRPPAPSRGARGGGRRAERRSGGRFRSCLPMLVVLVVVVAAAWFGGGAAVDKIKSMVGENPDYSGPGSGSAVVQVKQGDTAAAIGQSLKAAGVVKSVGAFTDAARSDERSRTIQVGYYQLKKEMKASDALAVLVDPKNLIQARVTIPEGYRVKDIVKAVAAKTDITAAQLNQVLKDPASIGLPAPAQGKVEGYLFPATYTVVPGETAKQLLTQMVAKTVEVQKSLDLDARAKALGYTPEEIMTVASILEYEGSRDEDYPKIARAIYNRLDKGMALQSDATVAYANNLEGTVWTTQAQRDNPSPYNTYVHTGLPPGPIGSPGEKTIEAALKPADGPWLYWLVVNLKTGETRFNTTLEGHNQDKAVLDKYCQTSDAC